MDVVGSIPAGPTVTRSDRTVLRLFHAVRDPARGHGAARSATQTLAGSGGGNSYAPTMGMNKDRQLAAIVGGLVAVFAGVGVIVAAATGLISS